MEAESSILGTTKVRAVIREGVKLPDVIVLSMNLHGIIEIEMPDLTTTSKLREAIKLSDILIPKHIAQIPSDITLIKMNAVALGVSNFLSPLEIRQEIDMIIRELSKPKYINIEKGMEKNIDVCKSFVNAVAINMKHQIFRNVT